MRSPVSVSEVYLLAAGRVAVLELGDLGHAGVQTQRLLEGPHLVWALGVGPETEIYLIESFTQLDAGYIILMAHSHKRLSFGLLESCFFRN